jgi:hypothetical protein
VGRQCRPTFCPPRRLLGLILISATIRSGFPTSLICLPPAVEYGPSPNIPLLTTTTRAGE